MMFVVGIIVFVSSWLLGIFLVCAFFNGAYVLDREIREANERAIREEWEV